MTVNELIQELSAYPGDFEVRIVDRIQGWDDTIHMVENEIYGLDPEKQVGICVN